MSPTILCISAKEIDALAPSMKDVMDAVETGFASVGRGQADLPAKIGVHPREDSFTHAMPCHIDGDIDKTGVKIISGYPANPAKGVPYINGTIVLTDSETGLTKAIMDAGRITALRTGAASGVYARHFGEEGTSTVSIVGTGIQSRVNLLAMKEVFPRLTTVHCFNPNEPSMDTFITDMQPSLPGATFHKHTNLKECVADADVVIGCTPMTTNPERPVRRGWLKNDCLAIAVDYDATFHADVFANAHFTCDNRNQYLLTQRQGGFFQNGYPDEATIHADLGEVCAGIGFGVREGRRGAVLMGIASHDIMTASLILDQASKSGVGTEVEL